MPLPRFGHSDVVIFSNKHQDVPPVNHHQKCLIKELCGIFDMKSYYFGPVILKKLTEF